MIDGKDYTVYIKEYEIRDLRRWHKNRSDKDYTDEQIIATSLHLYWYEKRKDELYNKYFGPGGSENYPDYVREVNKLSKPASLNDPMLNELERLWDIRKDNEANEEWENGPDDHRLYPDNNKDCKL